MNISKQLPHEISARLEASPIAWLPLGAIEFHGWHAPIGLDALTSTGLCERAAEKLGGIVFPPLHYGAYASIADIPLTILLDQEDNELLVRLLMKTLQRLENFGVKQVVILSGHFATCQYEVLEELEKQWNSQWRATKLHNIMLPDCPGLPIDPDHGGLFETALLQSVDPEAIDMSRLSDEPVIETNLAGAQRRDPAHPLYGILGADPRGVTAEQGIQLRDHLLHWICQTVSPPTN